MRDFISFLKRHHTVLDPTMVVFEGLFCGDPTAVTPGLEQIIPRFPPQVRRVMRSGALEVPPDKKEAYREAFPAMLRLLKALHDAGKLADLILVDGDPLKNMRDLDKITTVIKGGTLYAPAAIEKALGIKPRK